MHGDRDFSHKIYALLDFWCGASNCRVHDQHICLDRSSQITPLCPAAEYLLLLKALLQQMHVPHQIVTGELLKPIISAQRCCRVQVSTLTPVSEALPAFIFTFQCLVFSVQLMLDNHA